MRSVFALLALFSAAPALAAPPPDAPLPAGLTLAEPGLRFVDINGDGFDDLIFSNAQRHGVYLFNDIEKKNLGWLRGWPHIIREGKAGDAEALPLTTSDDVVFKDQAMWVKGVKHLSYDELCRPPAPPPRSPQDSLRAIHLPEGFVAELVVAEPLVQDPIFIDWDAQGRLWVVEMADYPFHEHKGQTHPGRVKVLSDTDDDGLPDKAELFLDDLMYPTGLAPWKDGVFVASVPGVFHAVDKDGDGRADQRTPVLDGFRLGNPQHLVNGFAWGLDGWLYGGNGDSGGLVTDLSTGKQHDLSGRDFRFHPQTREFQLQAGRAQYGRWRDDFGNWFANNNSNLGWHYFLDEHYLARNPKLAVKTLRQDLNPDGKRLYPISAPVRRLNQPTSINLLTSGCSPMPYRDSLFGGDYERSLFICEPANNLVHREVLEADGISFRSHRAASEQASEWLASEDNWSRFTQARTGPDGCVYVVDFYRLILEHPEWIPGPMLNHLDLRGGSDKGRIYRIRKANSPAPRVPKLVSLSDAELGQQLSSSNGWVRDTAQRLLIERQSQWTSEQLTGPIAAQVQQLWTMRTLGTLKQATLLKAMQHDDARVREQAARLAEDLANDAPVLAKLTELTSDSELRVRVQSVLSLGAAAKTALSSPQLAEHFAAVAKRDANQPAMLTALLCSAPEHPEAANWQAILKQGGKPASQAPGLKIITNANPDRDKVVKAYASAATLPGDATRGQALYLALCSACHRLKNAGNEIGPDLGTIAGKPSEQLIEAILDPSRAVEQRYLAQTVTLKNGQQHVGLIAEQTPNSLTLKLGASTEVILRADIAKTETSTKSMMPDGLESVLSAQQLADVLAWIRAK